MSEYKLLSAKECAHRLLGLSEVAILIHKNPDGDAVGSAAALCELLTQLGAKPYILSPDKIPDRLRFILSYTGADLPTILLERYRLLRGMPSACLRKSLTARI